MKILVACEESQAVTIELRRLGHEAYSCDIEPCSGGHPEWHLQVDALELLKMKWDTLNGCRDLFFENFSGEITALRLREAFGVGKPKQDDGQQL